MTLIAQMQGELQRCNEPLPIEEVEDKVPVQGTRVPERRMKRV